MATTKATKTVKATDDNVLEKENLELKKQLETQASEMEALKAMMLNLQSNVLNAQKAPTSLVDIYANEDSISVKNNAFARMALISHSDGIEYQFKELGDVIEVGAEDFVKLIRSKNQTRQFIENGIFELLNDEDYAKYKLRKCTHLNDEFLIDLLTNKERDFDETCEFIKNTYSGNGLKAHSFVYLYVRGMQNASSKISTNGNVKLHKYIVDLFKNFKIDDMLA